MTSVGFSEEWCRVCIVSSAHRLLYGQGERDSGLACCALSVVLPYQEKQLFQKAFMLSVYVEYIGSRILIFLFVGGLSEAGQIGPLKQNCPACFCKLKEENYSQDLKFPVIKEAPV